MKLPESSLIHVYLHWSCSPREQLQCMHYRPTKNQHISIYISKLWEIKVPFEGELLCCEKVKVPYLCNMYCEGVAWVHEFDSIDRCCLSQRAASSIVMWNSHVQGALTFIQEPSLIISIFWPYVLEADNLSNASSNMLQSFSDEQPWKRNRNFVLLAAVIMIRPSS